MNNHITLSYVAFLPDGNHGNTVVMKMPTKMSGFLSIQEVMAKHKLDPLYQGYGYTLTLKYGDKIIHRETSAQ